jgi:ADP-heptose:LPS heptosyltransferase
MNQTVNIILKSAGIGDLCILIAYIHAISKSVGKPVVVLAQKSTRASSILKNDPYVKEVIELDKKGFFNITKKIKPYKFDQSYIFSDSIRLYLIAKISAKEIFHYKFFSKKGKNFYKTAKEFTEKTLNTEVDPQSKIYCNKNDIEQAKKKFNISDATKNIVCGISASGPTKRYDINNYIKLCENLNSKFKCKFFLAGGSNDEDLIKKVTSSSIGNRCTSFSAMKIAETLPIIGACQYYIGNDTGWGHIASGLDLKSLFLFMDSPPSAYGVYSKNISIIVPDGETIESCGHNTRGKNKISVDKVLQKSLELIN